MPIAEREPLSPHLQRSPARSLPGGLVGTWFRRVDGVARAVPLLAAILLAGCATSPAPFKEFARAGRIYVASFDTLALTAAEAAVLADSRQLEIARIGLDRAERRSNLSASDKDMSERIAIIGELRRHTAILGAYFKALGDLADSKAPDQAASAAKTLGDSLAASGDRLAVKSLHGIEIGAILEPVTHLIVGRLRSNALRAELKARAGVLERELALQGTATRLLAEQLEFDVRIPAQKEYLDRVARPFEAPADLSPKWGQDRWALLSTTTGAPIAQRAMSAFQSVDLGFRGLVAGKFTKQDVVLLVADLNDIFDALRATQASLRSSHDAK